MKNSFFLLVFINLALSPLLNAQVSLQKRYGTNSLELEHVASAVAAPDGGLVFGGYTESGTQGAYDIFVQRINPDGTEAWLKTFGGPDLDLLTDLIPAADGGYLFSGYNVDAVDGSFDAVLGKINDNGDLSWWKTFGTPATEIGLTLCQRADGSVVLFGSTTGPANLPGLFRAIYDQNYNFVNAYLTSSSEDVLDINAVACSDGGYLAEITGGDIIAGEPDALLKFNNNHTLHWTTTPASIANQFGQTIGEIFDIEANASGLSLLLSASSGANNNTYLVQLSNASGAPVALKKVKDGYASRAGLHLFGDGTQGVAVLSSILMVKKLSSGGVTLDSVTVSAPSITGFNPEFLFPDQGNLYLFGNAGSFGQDDYAAARINLLPAPSYAWQQTFGEAGVPDRETGYAIASLPDNGFVLAGAKEDANGDWDVWLLRADAQGNILWEKTYSISSLSYALEPVGSVAVDAAGNIIVFAATDNSDPNYRLLKFSPGGALVFDKSVLTGDYTPEHFRAIPLPNGGFAACVTQNVFSSNPVPTIVRFDNSGNTLWTKTYANDATFLDIAALADGSLLVAGYQNNQPCMYKTDANGNLIWTNTFNTTTGVLNSVRAAADGSIFAAGASTNGGGSDIKMLVIKADAAGNLLMQKVFEKGTASIANTALPDANGGACLFGLFLDPPANVDLFSSIFRYRLLVAQVSASGNLVAEQAFGTDGTYPYGTSADLCPDGEVIFCATVSSGTALEDALVVKTDCTVGVSAAGPQLEGKLALSPNPAVAGGKTFFTFDFPEAKTLQIECYDLAGQKCWAMTNDTRLGIGQVELPVPNVSGTYLLKVTDGGGAGKTLRLVAR